MDNTIVTIGITGIYIQKDMCGGGESGIQILCPRLTFCLLESIVTTIGNTGIYIHEDMRGCESGVFKFGDKNENSCSGPTFCLLESIATTIDSAGIKSQNDMWSLVSGHCNVAAGLRINRGPVTELGGDRYAKRLYTE
jgi:hypothetical protein